MELLRLREQQLQSLKAIRKWVLPLKPHFAKNLERGEAEGGLTDPSHVG